MLSGHENPLIHRSFRTSVRRPAYRGLQQVFDKPLFFYGGSIHTLRSAFNKILRGLPDVVVSSTGCLKACDTGPVMIVYPENLWYGKVESESPVDEIIDVLEEGRLAEPHLMTWGSHYRGSRKNGNIRFETVYKQFL
jgi:(2Fe-2S) ferredoxin